MKLSYSAINTYETCPANVRFQYEERAPRSSTSAGPNAPTSSLTCSTAPQVTCPGSRYVRLWRQIAFARQRLGNEGACQTHELEGFDACWSRYGCAWWSTHAGRPVRRRRGWRNLPRLLWPYRVWSPQFSARTVFVHQGAKSLDAGRAAERPAPEHAVRPSSASTTPSLECLGHSSRTSWDETAFPSREPHAEEGRPDRQRRSGDFPDCWQLGPRSKHSFDDASWGVCAPAEPHALPHRAPLSTETALLDPGCDHGPTDSSRAQRGEETWTQTPSPRHHRQRGGGWRAGRCPAVQLTLGVRRHWITGTHDSRRPRVGVNKDAASVYDRRTPARFSPAGILGGPRRRGMDHLHVCSKGAEHLLAGRMEAVAKRTEASLQRLRQGSFLQGQSGFWDPAISDVPLQASRHRDASPVLPGAPNGVLAGSERNRGSRAVSRLISCGTSECVSLYARDTGPPRPGQLLSLHGAPRRLLVPTFLWRHRERRK